VEDQKVGIPTQMPGAQEQKLGIGDGIVGMLDVFVDPKGTAKRIPAPLSWIWPVITLIIIYVVAGYLMLPYTMSLIDLRINQQITQNNTPAEQAERTRNFLHGVYQYLPVAVPVIVILVLVLVAWLVAVMGSIAALRAKFRDIFSLMAACSLIQALQAIAVYIVVHAKGDEITSPEQLTPPFGLDIFLPNIHGALFALVNYFSIFQVWYLIVLTVGLAALAKSSKSKAFLAITPVWLLGVLYRVVSAMLQPN